MRLGTPHGALLLIPLLIALGIGARVAAAQPIVADDSMDTIVSPDGFGITGGTESGGNLFHSFERFGVPRGETALFTGPAYENVIARVTGGGTSEILGTLASTTGEHFYFVNPSGVIFGPDSNISVPGSFHVSTADKIFFGDGKELLVGATTEQIVSAADPVAFGFLDATPAEITVAGRLIVDRGETLELVGGDLRILGSGVDAPATGGIVAAPGGVLRLVSVGSAGTVTGIGGAGDGAGEIGLEGFSSLGKIEVADGAIVDASGIGPDQRRWFATGPDGEPVEVPLLREIDAQNGDNGGLVFRGGGVECGFCIADLLATPDPLPTDLVLDVNGSQSLVIRFRDLSAGSVVVRAHDLEVRDSDVGATSLGTEPGSIDIELRGDLTLGAAAENPFDTGILARGLRAEVHHAADTVIRFNPNFFVNVPAGTFELGADSVGGNVSILAANVDVRGGAAITATSTSAGDGGSIIVDAEHRVTLSGRSGFDGQPSGIYANADAEGDGGDIAIYADALRLDSGAGVFAPTTADGNAGKIDVDVGRLTILDDSQIDSSTSGQSLEGPGLARGNGGNISVHARESVLLSGAIGPGRFARISTFARERSEGDGGSIGVLTPQLELRDGAGISATTSGPGDGGDVTLDVADLQMDGGASITARSEGDASVDPGAAGDIRIGVANGRYPTRSVVMRGASSVETSALAAGGGNIFIDAPNGELVYLHDSDITTSVTSGEGSGGNITIDPEFVVFNGAEVRANADAGAGGNIFIRGNAVVISADSIVDASAGPAGVDGNVVIESPDVLLVTPLTPLPESFLATTDLMAERCAARASGEPAGTFQVSPYSALGGTPDAYLASPAAGYGSPARANAEPTSEAPCGRRAT